LLGCFEYKGYKVKRDYEQARQLFSQAARLGNAAALNNLAWLYQHGYGVPADLAKAVHYYTQSAALGYSSAQCNLGYLYFHGVGVEQDLAKAYDLFHRAMDTENPTAMFNLALWHLDPDAGHHDVPLATTLLKKCAQAGVTEARDLLAELHPEEAPRA
jgi:uncharacterized protein